MMAKNNLLGDRIACYNPLLFSPSQTGSPVYSLRQMKKQIPSISYGTYSPVFATIPLSMVTKLGLAHGKIAKLLNKAWKNVHGPIVDAEVRGLKYRLNLSDNATDIKILVSSKIYDSPELEALAGACQGKCFVDIGANIGYYTLNLAQAGAGRVIAIEPNPPTLARLRYNIDINGMNDKVTVIPAGVGPEGELDFHLTRGLGGSGFLAPAQGAPTIRVRTIPLLDILADNGVSEIGALKIDIEGFEDQALMPFFAAASASLLPKCVVIESCHAKDWKSDLMGAFLTRGYRLDRKTRSNHIFMRD